MHRGPNPSPRQPSRLEATIMLELLAPEIEAGRAAGQRLTLQKPVSEHTARGRALPERN